MALSKAKEIFCLNYNTSLILINAYILFNFNFFFICELLNVSNSDLTHHFKCNEHVLLLIHRMCFRKPQINYAVIIVFDTLISIPSALYIMIMPYHKCEYVVCLNVSNSIFVSYLIQLTIKDIFMAHTKRTYNDRKGIVKQKHTKKKNIIIKEFFCIISCVYT